MLGTVPVCAMVSVVRKGYRYVGSASLLGCVYSILLGNSLAVGENRQWKEGR